ncbi:transposase [Shewanella surugensis]|uniref:Transposase n=1 Tax=Shewanella surugensis TaxID=212020 RepID=A0ABT0LC57_9GAMM|nr:transposase [Shewanella surugensis]MCL1124776.1 transposase [Shewanella surugensis]
MPTPRKAIVSMEDTSFYHCISRCVRRAFLCGVDNYTGQSYEHRRDWVENRLLLLAEIFSIDVCAYAVMSNHVHLVLSIDIYQANSWNNREVVEHWHKLFKGTSITQKFSQGIKLENYEINILAHTIAKYRARLSDISWFMRALNEPIARMANKEDKCSGRFWEGRFKSQALLDEAAVIACMAYVDLNPIRAKAAKTLEDSNFTSIKCRIKYTLDNKKPQRLLPFTGNERKNMPKGLRFNFQDYFQLLNETGHIMQDEKYDPIDISAKVILEKLNIPLDNWVKLTSEFTRLFKGPVGTLQELNLYCEHLDKKRRQGAANCHQWLEP